MPQPSCGVVYIVVENYLQLVLYFDAGVSPSAILVILMRNDLSDATEIIMLFYCAAYVLYFKQVDSR